MKQHIVLEGLNGCGKGTQLAYLHEKLFDYDRSHLILTTREPNQIDEFGVRARMELNESSDPVENGVNLAKNMVGNRRAHRKLIDSALNYNNMWVLQDRNHCSTFAYQQTQGVPFETILQMHKSGYVPIPGLTIIFDVRPEEAVRRKGSSSLSGRKFDQNIGFNTSVRAKYASLADQLAGWDDSINYVDAMQSIDAVAEDTWAIVKNHYGL